MNSLKPAWSVDVGHVVFSSPVIGPDGTIYVGSLEEELIAINPDGTVKWRHAAGAPILAAPAVAENGLIYVLSTDPVADEDAPESELRGHLAVVGPDGEQIRKVLVPDHGFSTGSPKIFTINGDTFLVLHVRTGVTIGTSTKSSAVLVYDERLHLLSRLDVGCDPGVVIGSGPDLFGFIKGFLKRVKKVWDFDASTPAFPIDVRFGGLDSSPAVVHRPDLRPAEHPFIVVTDWVCAKISAFRWMRPGIVPVWEHTLTKDDTPLDVSSPAVLNNASLVIVGTRNGQVVAYDLVSGEQRWVSDIGEAIVSTPASIGEAIFVATAKGIHALNPVTGQIAHAKKMDTMIVRASPAVSGNKVHVQTQKELLTLSFDLSEAAHDDDGFGGTSSPALGADGTLYAVVQPGDPDQLERDTPARLVSYPGPDPGPGGSPIPHPPDGPVTPTS
jgi:outer membrane protein assembly factor BamB